MRYFIKNGINPLKDLTRDLEKYKTGSASIDLAIGDYLYIGSDAPFNHLYFKLGSTVNLNTSNFNIELWDGNEWQSVVEIIDDTNGFSESGYFEFVPDRDEQWRAESTNDNGQSVDGLESVVVYDLWWARISTDADITSGTEIRWAGHLFSDDDDLFSEYPVFRASDLLDCFESGKTDWEEQHVKAAEVIIKDLKDGEIIDFGTQILDRNVYRLASVAQVARIIYNSLGDDYVDDASRAASLYKNRKSLKKHKVDRNQNAILDRNEKSIPQGFMRR